MQHAAVLQVDFQLLTVKIICLKYVGAAAALKSVENRYILFLIRSKALNW
jgi:hypothetical protein